MKIGAVTIDVARASWPPDRVSSRRCRFRSWRDVRLNDRDQPGSQPVAVISEELARTYFANENPLGRRITLQDEKGNDEKRDLEIVGVSGNLNVTRMSRIESLLIPPSAGIPEPGSRW
jgi:hypothetical protein